MLAPILLTDTDADSTIPDCVALETIERLADEQAAALLHATATGGDDEAKMIAESQKDQPCSQK